MSATQAVGASFSTLLGFAVLALAVASNFTSLTVTSADGLAEIYEATPARWNAWQPKTCATGAQWRCQCPQPAGPLTPAVRAALIAAPGIGFFGLGAACGSGQVPPAPRRGPSVLVARRGECFFQVKVHAAHEAGYCGLLVANEDDGLPHPHYGRLELPDMTAGLDLDDSAVGIPAWLVAKGTGDAIFDRLQTGAVLLDAQDLEKKPAIGQAQEDNFGVRDHQLE